jgi:hypothetical protein
MAAVDPVAAAYGRPSTGAFDVLHAYGKKSLSRAQHKSRRRSASTIRSASTRRSPRSKSVPRNGHSSRRGRSLSPSGTLRVVRRPLALNALMSGLIKRNKTGLATVFPNDSTTVGKIMKEYHVPSHPEFAVGIYGKEYGDDWHMLTEAEWTNVEFQQELMAEYMKDNKYSWPLLEDPLRCKGCLFIEEGQVYINGATIDDENSQPLIESTIHGQYRARRFIPYQYEKEIIPVHTQQNSKRAEKDPKKGWKIHRMSAPKKAPCLFIRYV